MHEVMIHQMFLNLHGTFKEKSSSFLGNCFLQIDNVGNPSWQAQIKGTKKWTLEPPPECANVCDPKLEVTVNSGEISMSAYMFLVTFDKGNHCKTGYLPPSSPEKKKSIIAQETLVNP